MFRERSVNKVSPVKHSAQVNNFFSLNIAERLKYLISTEFLLGINRVYLLDCGSVKFWLSQLSTLFLFALTIYLVGFGSSHVKQYTVCRNTFCAELLLLSISGSYLQRTKLNRFFAKLSEFDRKLNIDSKSISPHQKQTIVCIVIIISSIVFDSIYVIKYMNTEEYYGWDVVNLGLLIHELEKLFFCTLLHTVLVRIRILEKHIAKAFNVEETETFVPNKENKISVISEDKVKLDVSSLQEAYELLQNTSEELKASMSFPMMVMLLSSGINTIFFLNYVFNENTAPSFVLLPLSGQVVKMSGHMTTSGHQYIPNTALLPPEYLVKTDFLFNLYVIGQCVKLMLLVIAPCHLAHSTSLPVTVIRTILHDAINCEDQDKMERRKIKAFYQLTKDNDITYVLWGLVKLDMYFPLGYSSLCTTYLVIVLQYSKFIV